MFIQQSPIPSTMLINSIHFHFQSEFVTVSVSLSALLRHVTEGLKKEQTTTTERCVDAVMLKFLMGHLLLEKQRGKKFVLPHVCLAETAKTQFSM